MKPWLYLDTARLGQMSPAAQHAQQDFARLAGEVGGAIQVEDLLKEGFEALSSDLQRRFPGLAVWRGIPALKRSLSQLAGFEAESPMLLASRLSELMTFAATLLCRSCQHILSTDLAWPPYQTILEDHCRRVGRTLTTINIAEGIATGRLSEAELVEQILSAFVRKKCDGLFFTSVSCTGLRTPIHRLTATLREQARFVVIDGAQEFCHLPPDAPRHCDLYLASCHKWLGSHTPLGMAILGRRRWRRAISRALQKAHDRGSLTDPLLRFTRDLEQASTCHQGETANLLSLFSTAGAAHDAQQMTGAGSFDTRLKNAARIAEIANSSGWQARLQDERLRTGILLVRRSEVSLQLADSGAVRRSFEKQGIALTAYTGGTVRLSLPATPLKANEVGMIAAALAHLA